MSPRTFAGRWSSTAPVALMLPTTSPSTMTVPQVISAETLAPSPMCNVSFVEISPVKLPSLPLLLHVPSFLRFFSPRRRGGVCLLVLGHLPHRLTILGFAASSLERSPEH
jgi:hypothetical protein